jgi:hypothetical protein
MSKIKISQIKLDSRNTNKHTEYGISSLNSSIEQVGIIESITISNDDVIISGNARHEVIGQKFNEENAIVIDTDGTKPIYLRRIDINSGTKEFHKASILANTVAQINQNIDIENIHVIAEEFEFKPEDVFVQNNKGSKYNATFNANKYDDLNVPKEYPITIIADEVQMEMFEKIRNKLNTNSDMKTFAEILKYYYDTTI